jgi:hypothetical protein
MEYQTKLRIGAVLSIFGAVGIIVILVLGLDPAPAELRFVTGFFIGLIAGIGMALAISGLLNRKIKP